MQSNSNKSHRMTVTRFHDQSGNEDVSRGYNTSSLLTSFIKCKENLALGIDGIIHGPSLEQFYSFILTLEVP